MGQFALNLAAELQIKVHVLQAGTVGLPDGRKLPILGHVTLPITVGGMTKETRVSIMPALLDECILGVNFIKQFRAVLDPDDDTLFFKETATAISLELASLNAHMSLASAGIIVASPVQREEMNAMIDRLVNGMSGNLGCAHGIEHVIDVGSARPIKQRYYPVSYKVEQEMIVIVKQMLKEGIIEPANSGWSSPIVMVRKKDGTYRLCIDFREVNRVTEPNAYPIPIMHDLLRRLKDAKFVSTIDLSSAYHQIKLAPEARPLTAFTVPRLGHFQFVRMPFGLAYAGATFQRLMDRVIGPDLSPFAFAYLDDIIVVSATFEEHLEKLELVLTRIREAGLTINPDKCEFCKPEVRYLGFIVDHEGLRPDPEKIRAITEYPRPKNLKKLRTFLGMASWYRRFLSNLASVAEPLTSLTKKRQDYIWGQAQEFAFERIKELMTSAPCLGTPDPEGEYILETDASATGLGVVLLQRVGDQLRIIEYASRVLNPAERNYSATEREALGVVWGIKKFRHYLEAYKFKVVTDHHSLKWLMNLKNPTGRLARWALELQSYQFEVIYRAGSLNHLPDGLSRAFEDEEGAENECCLASILSRAYETEIEATVSSLIWSSDSEDEWYIEKYKEVAENPDEFPTWKIVGRALYTYRPDDDLEGVIEDEDVWKLVVPRERREAVLQENHDAATAGHLGREKTYARMSRAYYWPGMYSDVRSYVKSCQICQQCKVEQRPPFGQIRPRTLEKPWQVVAGDIAGPFPRSPRGYEYALVFVDLFTRWVECIPLRQANGKAIVQALRTQVVTRWGTPKAFLTDNGTEFKNRTVDEYLQSAGITKDFTPIYHPQANPTERVIRTLKTMIVAFLKETHRNWDEYISEFVFAINTAVHSTTGLSPAILNYGRQLDPPAYIRRAVDQAAFDESEADSRVQWAERVTDNSMLVQRARLNARKEGERQAVIHNDKRRPTPFKVGDWVLKRNRVLSNAAQGVAAGLAPDFSGPFIISQVVGHNSYRLENHQEELPELVHAKDLKAFYSAQVETCPQGTEDSEVNETQPPGEIQTMSDPSGERASDSSDEETAPAGHESETPREASADDSAPIGERVARRGRGRPPKAAPPIDSVGSAGAAPAPAKRGRGRPKKAVYLVRRAATRETVPVPYKAPPKRGRGRPPKT